MTIWAFVMGLVELAFARGVYLSSADMLSEVDIGAQVSAFMWPLERLFLTHSAIVAFPRRAYDHGALNIILCVLPGV